MNIEYWLSTADDDWLTVQTLFDSKRYLHCLFFAHLCVEKISKAIWVKNNISNIPPKIHNIVKILRQSNIELNEEDMSFLFELNDFQIVGRYPDYLLKLSGKCNKEFTFNQLNNIQRIKLCLLEIVQ